MTDLQSTSLTLPYFRDLNELPSPLPTSAEIEASSVALPTIRNPRLGRIVKMGEHFVAKYGSHITENEGHALLLLEKYPSILAPRLCAVCRGDAKLYLIMESRPGDQLSELWPSLSEDEKLSITGQLRDI